jgi:hypothetical protein
LASQEEGHTCKDIHIDTESSSSDAIKQSKPSIPDYGSKDYWEARYKSNLLSANDDINTASTNADEAEQGTRIVDGIELSTEVQAGHAWYFSYEELRPLILRLVVDCDDDKEEVCFSSTKTQYTKKEYGHRKP